MTEKNIFAYKLFFSLKITVLIYFYVKTATPPLKKSPPSSGFATGVANMRGAPPNLVGGLKSKHWWIMGELKMLLKSACEAVHLIVKLPVISLQACKFTKNVLLHTYFPRILARF